MILGVMAMMHMVVLGRVVVAGVVVVVVVGTFGRSRRLPCRGRGRDRGVVVVVAPSTQSQNRRERERRKSRLVQRSRTGEDKRGSGLREVCVCLEGRRIFCLPTRTSMRAPPSPLMTYLYTPRNFAFDRRIHGLTLGGISGISLGGRINLGQHGTAQGDGDDVRGRVMGRRRQTGRRPTAFAWSMAHMVWRSAGPALGPR